MAPQPNAKNHTWEKLLYKSQPYPDNYVPESFLDQLKTNSNVKLYPFRKVSLEACGILQQMSCIAIFFGIFVNCHAGIWRVTYVTAVSAIIVVIGTLGWARGIEKLAKEQERLLQAQLGADRQRSYSNNMLIQQSQSCRSSVQPNLNKDLPQMRNNDTKEAKDVPLAEFKTPLIAGTVCANLSPPCITSKIMNAHNLAIPQPTRKPFVVSVEPLKPAAPEANPIQTLEASARITSPELLRMTPADKSIKTTENFSSKISAPPLATTPELFRRPAWEMSCIAIMFQ